ncbi:MAG: hypothetical protein B9S32_16030 [Verrucomicrobia bacterium Tous-C9LFEB]|nr:MAG: hypothetical protein B9S32_16030 [Verrucomicrobia bacterium Tous-C9LFEB]
MCAVLLAVTLVAPRLASAATVIYSDDFSGLSSANLDGTAPDTRSGTDGGSASATWIADTSAFKASGTVTGQSGNMRYALLAFTPIAGNIYTLKVDLNTTDFGSVNYLAAGFTSNAATSTSSTALNAPWMSMAANGVGKIYYNGQNQFSDGGTFGTAGSVSNPITLTLVLDTTSALWKTSYSVYDFTTLGVVSSGAYNYTVNPTITSVFIGDIIYGGTVDNFSLTVVPEPNAIALFGMAILVSVGLIRLRASRTRFATNS